jgi:hypothetical protein
MPTGMEHNFDQSVKAKVLGKGTIKGSAVDLERICDFDYSLP